MSTEQINNQKDSDNSFNVGSIFSSRTLTKTETAADTKKPVKEENSEDKKPVARSTDIEDVKSLKKEESKQDIKVEPKKEEDGDISSEDIDYKSKIEKLEKTVKDTQRSFHEDRKKLTAYKRAVQKMVDDGVLVESEAETLLDHTSFQDLPSEQQSQSVLDRYINIWDKEISYMRKYSRDSESIDQNIAAFQHLFDTSSMKEKEEIMDELSSYEDDEVELTNQMLAMGAQYNEEIYSDIREAGGIRKLKEKFRNENEILQNKLDKVTKQYNKLKEQYEDYDQKPSNMRLQSGSIGSSIHSGKNATPTVKNIFGNRFQRT
jgi:hypothetical protein